MDINYSEIIQAVIRKQASIHRSDDVGIETIFDTERHHYLLVHVGIIFQFQQCFHPYSRD